MIGSGRVGPAFENPADDEHPRPLLEVDDLRVRFDRGRETVRAVDGLSFALERGEIVGLVGESGCGKSAAVRAVAGLHGGDARVDGTIRFDGTDLREVSNESLRRLRATRLSTVFQDPSATLTPTRTVEAHLMEALRLAERPDDRSLRLSLGFDFDLDPREWGRRDDRRERAVDLLEAVGLDARALEWYPHECSGGEAQRVSLAVALASDPDVLLADEPTTALDATTRAEILALLESIVAGRELGIVLVSHDLGLVADVCDRVVVAYAGRVMEAGPTDRVLESPRHPYTRALLGCRLDSVEPGKRLPTIEGEVPDPTVEPAGCPFAPRCPWATDECRNAAPPVVAVDDGDGGGDGNGDGGRVRCGELERVAASEAPGANAVTAADGGALERRGDGTSGGDREHEGRAERRRRSTDANGNRTAPALELCGVSKRYPLEDSWAARTTGRDRWYEAVRDVSLAVRPGETLGIVGESGAGKSTVIDLVTGLEEPTAGTVRIDGEPAGRVNERTREQLVAIGRLFQHPRSSLDPRQPVRAAIAEPLRESGLDREKRRVRIEELLSLVGLEAHHADRRPGQLSGGECQRVGLARAVALEPALVVLDEPTSVLDVSVRARVCNLLLELQRRLGSAFVLVSHDLGVVVHLADRIAVMRDGRVVESGPADRICESPTLDYTERLLAAANVHEFGTGTDSSERATDHEAGSESGSETERERTG